MQEMLYPHQHRTQLQLKQQRHKLLQLMLSYSILYEMVEVHIYNIQYKTLESQCKGQLVQLVLMFLSRKNFISSHIKSYQIDYETLHSHLLNFEREKLPKIKHCRREYFPSRSQVAVLSSEYRRDPIEIKGIVRSFVNNIKILVISFYRHRQYTLILRRSIINIDTI